MSLKLGDESRFHRIPAQKPEGVDNPTIAPFSIQNSHWFASQVTQVQFWLCHCLFVILCHFTSYILSFLFCKMDKDDYSLFQSLVRTF